MTLVSRPTPLGRMFVFLAGLVAIFAHGEAHGAMRLDFEQPYFVEEQGLQCKDHALVKKDGIYHLYYIQSFPPEPPDYLRSEKWLGHLTSTDMRRWARQDSILPVSQVPPGTWNSKFIWAPKVVEYNGNYLLYYTGVSGAVTQQAGLALSYDLHAWTRWPISPIYAPGDWAAWAEGSWSNCRDPEVFYDSLGDEYLMLNTATTAEDLGAISLGTSTDLIYWEDQGPFFVNDSSAVLESVQLVEAGGLYHLLFTEQWVQGTSHVSSPTLYGPWSKDGLTIIDLGNAPEVSDLGDETVFSRHNAIITPDGPLYYYRFDHIDMMGVGGVPEILPLADGLGGDWSVLFGTAFNNQPTWGDNPYFRGDESSNMEGNSYVATNEDFPEPIYGQEGDTQGYLPVGFIRTEPFMLTENRISLLVGGGDNIDRLFVGLVWVADETLLFMETGTDSHAMDLRIWNCESLIGEEVYLVAADLSFEQGGFLSMDSLVEYTETGVDSVIPSLPMVPGPLLDDVLAAAGYDLTAAQPGDDQPAIPQAGRLLDPHPNPFNPRSHLRYELSRDGRAELTIHDATGRRVRELLAAELPAGPGFVIWDGRDGAGISQPSGVYFARLTVDGAPVDRKKLTLLR